jgi:hypothetical protein
MEIYELAPGEGKTTLVIEWLALAPEGERRVALFPTARDADRAWKFARDSGLELRRDQFVDVRLAPYALHGYPKLAVAVDDLDRVLHELLGTQVEVATSTREKPPVRLVA